MIEILLEQIRQKNRNAEQEFYHKYSILLFRVAYRYVNNEYDAGSIVNSGFYKIFKNINKFNYINEQKLIAWAKKIVINEALLFLRNKLVYEELKTENTEVEISKSTSVANLIIEDYYKVIKELPDDLRTVFNLYAIDGYSHKEIAQQLNIKESSSRVYLTRARKILQKKIKFD